jgi:23S rRNA (cytidine1920-2'-O)/16S rRNA (cytidine1409-2'-O)-methyltransferase
VTDSLKKERIDKLLVDRGLVSTRTRAKELILQGSVLVNQKPETRPGVTVLETAEITLLKNEMIYVSRGALKLKAALEQFKIEVSGKNAIDIGASTGGFTEILLLGGAKKVCAVDVGTGQMAARIKDDPRVETRENYNARNFKPEDFQESFQVLVMDVSFISIRLLIPSVLAGLAPGAPLVVLFKPQFEVGREAIGSGGIVGDQILAQNKLRETITWAEALGLQCQGTMSSPILGTDGNHEYLIHWVKR